MTAGEPHQLPGAVTDRPQVARRSTDGDAATASKFQQPFVAQLTQRSEHGVAVDAESDSQVTRRRQSLPSPALLLRDRPPERTGDLLVQRSGVAGIDMNQQHGAINTSTMSLAAFVPVLIALAAFDIFCLVDLARSTTTRYVPRWVWALLCLASSPMGGVLYLLLGRTGQ